MSEHPAASIQHHFADLTDPRRREGTYPLGTQGLTGLASLVVGSVARKVMAGAHCTVVTVKTQALSNVGS